MNIRTQHRGQLENVQLLFTASVNVPTHQLHKSETFHPIAMECIRNKSARARIKCATSTPTMKACDAHAHVETVGVRSSAGKSVVAQTHVKLSWEGLPKPT